MAHPYEQFVHPMDCPPPMHPVMHMQHHPFGQFVQQPHPELLYNGYPYGLEYDYMPYPHHGMMLDEFDDANEISTRPRLTKDQVEILESQFQAHPKPNSMVKKELARQTKLSLPRVANWFQNRRAKAKQQKKQEEYHAQQQSLETKIIENREDDDDDDDDSEDTEVSRDTVSKSTSPAKAESVTPLSIAQESSGRLSPINASDVKDVNVQSIQHALKVAAEAHRGSVPADHVLVMPPPELSHAGIHQPSSKLDTMAMAEWTNGRTRVDTITTSVPADMGFDFGFDQDIQQPDSEHTGSTSDHLPSHYVMASEDWPSLVPDGSRTMVQSNDDYTTVSAPLPIPNYTSSRRGSGAEDLANNFGTFALAGTPPLARVPISQPTEIDLASRRKRPRPAALTSASLRSRSYGQLSATSPGFRQTTLNGAQLRHVKSTGHNLNGHYAGIRKSSLPTKSPLTTTFADTEAFKKFMAEQAASSPVKTAQLTSAAESGPLHSAKSVSPLSFGDSVEAMPTPSDSVTFYKRIHSPPITPYQHEFMPVSNAMHPPMSATTQFATLPDYTPPYSAGPMTNSTTCSWSDQLVVSPDLPNFSNSYMSSVAFGQQDPAFTSWMLPTDHFSTPGIPDNFPDKKSTEFYITEFPDQKQQHAIVASKVTHSRPKEYHFSTTTVNDFDQ